jgi:hypothetical protein
MITKSKITITIDKNNEKTLDNYCIKNFINKSKLINYLIDEFLKNKK